MERALIPIEKPWFEQTSRYLRSNFKLMKKSDGQIS